MTPEETDKRKPAEAFAEMFRTFGEAISEIFNDPRLKDKAREFGKSAGESAETFGKRFKDEEVRQKFRDVGSAAQAFGKSIADYFEEKEK
jgi:hypothetical protein